MLTLWPLWLVAVLRITPRMRSPSRCASGRTLEQQYDAALAGYEAVGLDVERVAVAGARQHARRRRRYGPARLHHHVDAASEGELALAIVQAATGLMDRRQARRTRCIHRDRRSMQSERMRNLPRSHAEERAGIAIRSVEGIGGDVHELVIAIAQPDEDAGLGGDRVSAEAGMLHGLPRDFQQQPMLRVHRGCFAFGDAEEVGIEVTAIVEERAPFADGPAGHARLGIVIVIGVPAAGRNLRNEVGTTQQRIPELIRELMPSGSRHAIPMTATGVTLALPTVPDPSLSIHRFLALLHS